MEEQQGQDEVLKTYLWVSMFILVSGLVLFANVTQTMFFGENKKSLKEVSKNPILVAWYLLLPPNILMSVVYFIEHLSMLINGTPSTPGGLCNFVAFFAICAVVSINGSSITISFLTYRLVRDGKKPDLKIVLIGNGISWGIGLIISIIFMTGNSIGPYQGLYCCVKESEYRGFRVALIFTSFCVSLSTQAFFYFRAWHLIRGTEDGGLQSTGTVKASRVIMKRGLEMVAIFYCCWFIICVDSCIAYNGGLPSRWTSAVGAWFAKMNPVLHCLMMYRNLRRMRKVVGVASVHEDADHKAPSQLTKKTGEAPTGLSGSSLLSVQQILMKISDLLSMQQNLEKKMDTFSSNTSAELASVHESIKLLGERDSTGSANEKKVKEEQLLAEIQILRLQLAAVAAKDDKVSPV